MKRKQALKGELTHYFTGKPCIRDHIANRTSKDGVCIECASTLTREWQLRNKKRYTKYQSNWRETNDPVYECNWRKQNPGKRALYNLQIRTAKQQRTPMWLTKKDWKKIDFFYDCCPAGCEVDHIVPLNGKNISGLHVPNNLQWLSTTENRSKGNKF